MLALKPQFVELSTAALLETPGIDKKQYTLKGTDKWEKDGRGGGGDGGQGEYQGVV